MLSLMHLSVKVTQKGVEHVCLEGGGRQYESEGLFVPWPWLVQQHHYDDEVLVNVYPKLVS